MSFIKQIKTVDNYLTCTLFNQKLQGNYHLLFTNYVIVPVAHYILNSPTSQHLVFRRKTPDKPHLIELHIE